MKSLLPLLIFLFMFHNSYAAELVAAGKVVLVEGQVWVQGSDQKIRPIKKDEPLYNGDIIMTGLKGELQARMADEGLIAVRPNSKLKIDAYRANGDEDDSAIFSLIRGTFRSVTGWIGKFNRKKYAIKAGTVTIGVRGTDHEPAVIKSIPGMKPLGTPGVYDKVNAGRTVMRNAFGEAEFGKGQVGFIGFKSRQAPTRLKAPPTFFKPSRHENQFLIIKKNHNTVLEQRLKLRQQQIRLQPGTPASPQKLQPRLLRPLAAPKQQKRKPDQPARKPGTNIKPMPLNNRQPLMQLAPSRSLPAIQSPQPMRSNTLQQKTVPQRPMQKPPAIQPVQPQLKSTTPTMKLPAAKPPTEKQKEDKPESDSKIIRPVSPLMNRSALPLNHSTTLQPRSLPRP